MSYEIQISHHAKDDLRSIYSYIAVQLKEPQIAAKQYGRIKSAILTLGEMPERHPLYTDEPWQSRGLRKFMVDNYLVFYLIDKVAHAVVIVRVMYGGRDIQSQLESTP